jgi:hypothetical protein
MGYGICGAHGLHGCDINPPPPRHQCQAGIYRVCISHHPLLLGGFEPCTSVVTEHTDLSTIL